MIRYTIYANGRFLGFSTATNAQSAIEKYARLHEASTKGLTAARPVN